MINFIDFILMWGKTEIDKHGKCTVFIITIYYYTSVYFFNGKSSVIF
jgi:hypothetical protein